MGVAYLGGRGTKQTNSPEWAARGSKGSLQRPEEPRKMKIKAYSGMRFTLRLQALYREKLWERRYIDHTKKFVI